MVAKIKAKLPADCYSYHGESMTWRLAPKIECINFVMFDDQIELTDFDIDKLEVMLNRATNLKEKETIFEQLAHALDAPELPEILKRLVKRERAFEWSPKSYQWVLATYIKNQDVARAGLFDPMGVGKSVQAILASMLDKYVKHNVLIICPANNVGTWRSELMRMFGQPAFIITNNFVHVIHGVRYYIVSYDQTHKVKTHEDFFLIIDEVHKVKNIETRRWKRLKGVRKWCTNRIVMSGTPIENRAEELFAIFTILDDNFMDWHEFCYRYCNLHTDRYGKLNATGLSHPEELYKMLYQRYGIRRPKKALLPWLPDKTRCVVELDKLIPEGDTVFEMYSKNAEAKVLHQKFWEWLDEDILEENKQVILFFHHAVTGRALKKHLESLGRKYIFIDGSVPGVVRDQLQQKFQTDPDYDAILSITAAGTGLTLTACSCEVIVEPTMSPGVLEQAEDRAHRLGQKSNVTVFIPIISKFEHYLIGLIIKKLGVIARVIEGRVYDTTDDESLLKSLSREFGKKIGKKAA